MNPIGDEMHLPGSDAGNDTLRRELEELLQAASDILSRAKTNQNGALKAPSSLGRQ
jgi:hypothetical protein